MKGVNLAQFRLEWDGNLKIALTMSNRKPWATIQALRWLSASTYLGCKGRGGGYTFYSLHVLYSTKLFSWKTLKKYISKNLLFLNLYERTFHHSNKWLSLNSNFSFANVSVSSIDSAFSCHLVFFFGAHWSCSIFSSFLPSPGFHLCSQAAPIASCRFHHCPPEASASVLPLVSCCFWNRCPTWQISEKIPNSENRSNL